MVLVADVLAAVRHHAGVCLRRGEVGTAAEDVVELAGALDRVGLRSGGHLTRAADRELAAGWGEEGPAVFVHAVFVNPPSEDNWNIVFMMARSGESAHSLMTSPQTIDTIENKYFAG
ncbi:MULTISPECIES: hypothetical protein [unclassified Kitasatospora]|uniref:hypothetical protein n=1 Tax=unclassified Kitasatospora TaxID=2633591 RepID=UPI0033FE00FA